MAQKEGFYRVELINTVWEVPERYQNLMPVGNGAFGQVSNKEREAEDDGRCFQVCSATDTESRSSDSCEVTSRYISPQLSSQSLTIFRFELPLKN